MSFAPSLSLLLRRGAPRGTVHFSRTVGKRSSNSVFARAPSFPSGGSSSLRPISSYSFSTTRAEHGIDDALKRRGFSSDAASVVKEDNSEENTTCSTFGTWERFDALTNLHPLSQKAIKDVLKLETMTEIQSKTFDAASSGRDVLGRARTGTGKTLAFLLPALETVLRYNDDPGTNIGILVLSPTRELALQIHQQAKMLTSTHPDLTSQVMFGGSPRQQDVKRLTKRIPTILVATPGRLQDHLTSTTIQNTKFSNIVQNTRVVVLDETDRLLDLGFRSSIEKIMSYMPPKSKRQTLLFSATIPSSVKSVINQTMKEDYLTVDCIHDHDPTTHINKQVSQHHVILPTKNQLSGCIDVILNIMKEQQNSQSDYKMVVFFPTTLLTAYYSYIFNVILKQNVIEIHSRKSQSYRTNASNTFRQSKGGVTMFTSDVSARGVDYPNVTHVIQVGMADSRETYIHRLGRTGRAGKKGRGILILTDVERNFLNLLDGLDIPHLNDGKDDAMMEEQQQEEEESYDDWFEESEMIATSATYNNNEEQISKEMNRVQKALQRKHPQHKFPQTLEGAYRSMLGYYTSNLKSIGVRSKKSLVQLVNDFALEAGLEEPPRISPKVVKSVGLVGVRGLNVGHVSREGGRGGFGGGGNGAGRGDGRSKGYGRRRGGWEEDRGVSRRRERRWDAY